MAKGKLKYVIREASEDDVPVVMDLVKQLAVYEKLIGSYTATDELYRRYGWGIGTALLRKLAQIALEKDCGRMEWTVLDWNEPSRQYYFSLGAKAMDEWTTFRLTPPEIKRLAEA